MMNAKINATHADTREEAQRTKVEFKERAMRVRPASRYPVEVHIMGDKFLDIFHARDISVTGIGIYVPYRFHGCNIHDGIDLCITLPHERPFMAKGRVIHRSQDDRPFYGICFTMLLENHRQRIQSYIQKRLSELPASLQCTYLGDTKHA